MRKVYLLLITLVFCSTIYAHPPSEIAATYNSNTEAVQAIITHPVNDPESHFIEKVEILLNGEKIIEDEFIRQENKDNQTIYYTINADVRSGDKILVVAYCSISGKSEQEITAE